MLQTNSVFNFFNLNVNVYELNKTKFLVFKGQNVLFYLSFEKSIFDIFNNHFSSYRYKKRLNKSLMFTYFYNFFFIYWFHISFKGKSYRIRAFKKVKRFTFNLGYSHWTRLKLNKFWKIMKRRRQKYVLFTETRMNKVLFGFFFRYLREMNRYTLRGIRLSKQPIKRRFGKISQHISSLH